jgi:hypothetical protein
MWFQNYFWSYPYFNVRQKYISFRFDFDNDGFKNGKAARFNNEPLLFTGWHKAALVQN